MGTTQSERRKWQTAFEELKPFFKVRLPRYEIRVVSRIEKDGHYGVAGYCDRAHRIIYLERKDEKIMLQTLTHEMAHVATNNYHGKKFHDEMHRLSKVGAPVAEHELAKDHPKSHYLNKAWLQGMAEDLFLDLPELSTDQAISIVARTGLSFTVKEFVHRYPWARKIIADARTDARADANLDVTFQ